MEPVTPGICIISGHGHPMPVLPFYDRGGGHKSDRRHGTLQVLRQDVRFDRSAGWHAVRVHARRFLRRGYHAKLARDPRRPYGPRCVRVGGQLPRSTDLPELRRLPPGFYVDTAVFAGVRSIGWRRVYRWSDFQLVRDVRERVPWSRAPVELIELEGKTRVVFGSMLRDRRRQFLIAVLRKMLAGSALI